MKLLNLFTNSLRENEIDGVIFESDEEKAIVEAGLIILSSRLPGNELINTMVGNFIDGIGTTDPNLYPVDFKTMDSENVADVRSKSMIEGLTRSIGRVLEHTDFSKLELSNCHAGTDNSKCDKCNALKAMYEMYVSSLHEFDLDDNKIVAAHE